MTQTNFSAKPIPLSVFYKHPGADKVTMLGYEKGHQFQKFVPEEEDGYVHVHDFIREYRSWHDNPGEMGFMIVGPTGCGKTTSVLAVNAKLNIPTLIVNCHGDMSMYELKGSMQFVTDPNSNQSVMKYKLGPLALAFKYGFTVVLDEFNLQDPDLNAGLNEIVRGKVLYIEQTGEIIKRHPMFRIIASGNDWGRGDGESRNVGMKMQNAAFLNRWWKFKATYPNSDVEEEILATKLPKLNKELIAGMVKVANFIRPAIRGVGNDEASTVLDVDFSTRTLIEWGDKSLRFYKTKNPLKNGLEIVLLRGCNRDECEVIERACLDVLGNDYNSEN
jgi:cobaltochelatase CobS